MKARWAALQALVIDECSMVSDAFLDMIDKVARRFKDSSKPFGGIQLILVGDFYQLPPIGGDYCFVAESYEKLRPHVVNLVDPFRHAQPEWDSTLVKIRKGQVDDATDTILRGMVGSFAATCHPVRLYGTNKKVEDYN